MRTILWLAAAAGVAAIGTAAQAGSEPAFGGQGGGWASAPAGGHRAGGQRFGRPGIGRGRHRDGRFGRPGRRFLYVHGGYGFAGPAADPYGNGFFAGGGGEVRMRGGRPHYDYDRSYPYEWSPGAGGRAERAEEALQAEPPPRCTIEYGVRVCRGW